MKTRIKMNCYCVSREIMNNDYRLFYSVFRTEGSYYEVELESPEVLFKLAEKYDVMLTGDMLWLDMKGGRFRQR